jgi:Spy/CpxP family protein refolding chaperone
MLEKPMKITRAMSAMCVLLLLGPAVLFAQPRDPRPQRPVRQGPMLERIHEALDTLELSAEQRQKIDQILDDAREELRSSMPEMRDMDPQQRREQMRDRMASVHKQVEAELNEQQQAQLKAKLDEIRGPAFGPPGARDGVEPPPGPPPAPGAGPGPDRQRPVMEMLRHAFESLDKLELSDEQKQKLDAVRQETRAAMQQLRAQAEKDFEELAKETRQLLDQAREQINTLLTPEQQARFRELLDEARRSMRDDRGPGAGRGPGPGLRSEMEEGMRPPAPRDRGPREPRGEQRQLRQRDREPPPAQAPPPPPPPPQQPEANAPAGQTGGASLAVGDPAPDLTLERLNGRPLQLSSFKGRVVVITFGSHTSPHFRQRAPQLEELRRTYGPRAVFVLVYTSEAHPTGQWELARNHQEQVRIAPHADIDARRAAAKGSRDALGLKSEILLDPMDNAAARAYGAGQSGAVIIGRDGKIVVVQNWLDPWGLKPWIDQAIEQPAPSSSADAQ